MSSIYLFAASIKISILSFIAGFQVIFNRLSIITGLPYRRYSHSLFVFQKWAQPVRVEVGFEATALATAKIYAIMALLYSE